MMSPQGSKVMHQSGAEALITEEPDVLIGLVRICGGLAGNRWVYPEADAEGSGVSFTGRSRSRR
jgi:hypothetical protein